MTTPTTFATIDTEVKIEVEGIAVGSEGGPSAIGYGTLALGSALVVAYLFKKQQDMKKDMDVDDEDYQRVVHD